MKRAEIIVKGKVQRVGYRDIVLDIARDTNGTIQFSSDLRILK